MYIHICTYIYVYIYIYICAYLGEPECGVDDGRRAGGGRDTLEGTSYTYMDTYLDIYMYAYD